MGIAYNTSIVRNGISFQIDYANVKSYPGTGTTVTNLANTGNFTLHLNPTFSNGVMSFNGLNPGSYSQSPSGLGNHGVNSFTYQLLVRPKSSTSINSANEARLYEHSGFPETYHILTVQNNGGNPWFLFFGGGTSSVTFAVNSPSNSAVLNNWYLLTTIIDRSSNKCVLYVNTNRYESNISISSTPIGDNDPIHFPSTYAEAEADYSCIIGYTRALTEAEVLQNFNALRGRYGL